MFPENQMQRRVRSRFRGVVFFMSVCVFTLVVSMLDTDTAFAAAIKTVRSTNQSVAYTDGITSNPTSIANYAYSGAQIPISAIISKIELKITATGSVNGTFRLRQNGGGYQMGGISACSRNWTSSVFTQTCDWTASTWLTLSRLNSASFWIEYTNTGDGNVSRIYIDSVYLEVTYGFGETTEIQQVSTAIIPNQSSNFKLAWSNYLESNTFNGFYNAYYFPSGRVNAGVCDGLDSVKNKYGNQTTECELEYIPLWENRLINNSTFFSGSGTFPFSFTYPVAGSFTGAIVLTSFGCTMQDIDSNEVCTSSIVKKGLVVSNYELTTAFSAENVVTTWVNGGQSGSGFYFVSDKQNYTIGEPVRLKWRYTLSPLIVSKAYLYRYIGDTSPILFDGVGLDEVDVFHYATLYYSLPNTYQPFVRVCVGDCSTTWRDMYLGALEIPQARYALYVANQIFSSNQVNCSARGVFGLDSSMFLLSFGTGSNILVSGAEIVANKGIQSFVWLASNLLCVLDETPLVSDIKSVVNPDSGEVLITPEKIWGYSITGLIPVQNFTITYNTTENATKLWDALVNILIFFALFFFILDGIFGRK